MVHQKELQDARAEAEKKLHKLLLQQSVKIDEIQDGINSQMGLINRVVTENQETAPILHISHQKDIVFETPGNTSEGTAFKKSGVYDLRAFLSYAQFLLSSTTQIFLNVLRMFTWNIY